LVPRIIIGNIAALVLGGLLVGLEIWTVAPGPTLPTLILAVAVPEGAPWGIAVCVVALVLIQCIARSGARRVATALGAVALGCAIVPLLFVNAAIAAADRELHLALGPAYAALARERDPAPAWRAPFNLATSFLGYSHDTAIRSDLDLPVRTRDGARLGLDVYRPAEHGKHATVVLIYGGAWRSGTRGDVAERARAYASLGYTTIAIDYRHAPAFHYPTQIEDVQDALATIARNANVWEVDRSRVALVGHSSGGELALLAAYSPGPLTVKAVVAFYSPIDLAQGYALPPVPDPADVREILTAYIGGIPLNLPAQYVAASPIAHVRRGLPPTLLIGGRRDELVLPAFQYEMHDRLRRVGVPVALIDLPWSNHVFDEVPGGVGGQIARAFTERFLAATLRFPLRR
jgi:acetyl esterase/lipase